MKIAILGAGNTGCSIAADYSLRGHEVALIKTSHAVHDDNFAFLESNGGVMTMDEFGDVKTARIARVTRDLSAMDGAQAVLMCVQTGCHRELLGRVAPRLRAGQLLLIVPGYLSTAYALRSGLPGGVIIAEAESAFIDGRIMRPGYFRVGFRNVLNPVGVYPGAALPEARRLLDGLGTPFSYLDSVAEAALHNPNMIVHTVGAVMSIPRVEATNGDYCMYHEVFTPAVWSMLEALDGEKMAVLEQLGFRRLPYVEACRERNSTDRDEDAKAVFLRYAAMPTRAKGPTSVHSRYITEDVPQGLVMLESLGVTLGVPTPVATAIIELASAALGYDMRAAGRSVEALGRETLRRILSDRPGQEEKCPT